MPEPSITTPFLTTRSYGIVRSSHPGPMGHAHRRRRIVLRCSGRREAGTTVGGLLEVRAGDVVAGAASPGHTAGGVPFVGGLPRCETRVRLPRTISTSRA